MNTEEILSELEQAFEDDEIEMSAAEACSLENPDCCEACQ